ncbi:MAG TPA: glycoside hydrolase family 15 protein, partial [Actinomycetota bacterium]|nr:glycoside hydrolase family 15 protein [Actinomycetota bacterium]
MRVDGYPLIGDYGVVGDGRTAALISTDGAVEWLCLPDLDSPSVFGAMLDAARGGRFELAPEPPFETDRRYLPGTNVLETTHRTSTGVVRVIEAFTLEAGIPPPWRELVRRVEGLEGTVELRWSVEPGFDYGARAATFTEMAEGFVADGPACRIGVLAWDAGVPEVRGDGAVLAGRFSTGPGSRSTLALVGDGRRPLRLPSRGSVERRLEGTIRDWRDWISRSTYRGQWAGAVERSLLALKLLQNPETGAIAAAATASLPERIGGDRNLDYRFGWIRDIAFTLEALMRLGFEDDAHRSLLWLLDAVAGSHPRPAPLYALGGGPAPSSRELPLPGYRGSRPVMIGNQAVSQLQLSGWGDLLQAVWMHVERGANVLDARTGERLADLADVLAATWPHPDAGLWELREPAQFANSKMGCWVAFDRILNLVDWGQVPPRH